MAVQSGIQKHAGGRPLKYKSAKQLEEAIEDYFAFCDNRMVSVYIKEAGDNVQISNPAPYTMSGLAYKLGIDRDTLLRYSKSEEFYGTIKMARMRVEQDVEQRLMEGKNQAGAIFNLKNNFGWVDKSEVDNKHEMVQPLLSNVAKKDDSDTTTDVIDLT